MRVIVSESVIQEHVHVYTHNTVSDIYATAKVAFLHPRRMQYRKTKYRTDDCFKKSLPREYIKCFIVSHITGEILTLKK